MMSFIYKENNSGPRTVPCGTPDKTGAHWDFDPLTTTLCCLLHRNESIHTDFFSLMPYPWSLHFRSSWGGVSNAFSKSNKNVSTWPPASKILAQSFITDQLSFTATILPESMLPVWQKLVYIKMSHNICTYYMFKHLARNTCQGHWTIVTW